jgi:hypothetical protein
MKRNLRNTSTASMEYRQIKGDDITIASLSHQGDRYNLSMVGMPD